MKDQSIRPHKVVAFLTERYEHKLLSIVSKLGCDTSYSQRFEHDGIIVRMTGADPEGESALREMPSSGALVSSMLEAECDEVALLAAHTCNTSMAAIVLTDGKRPWVESKLSLDAFDMPTEASFYVHTILAPRDFIVVRDARNDDRFRNSPLVLNWPEICFYAGAPLLSSDGTVFGTLCVADSVPRDLSPVQRASLVALARQVTTLFELRRRQAELERVNMLLAQQSVTDGLTGLVNRRAFEERLDAEVKRSLRYGVPFSLLMIDVDAFKYYNDVFGHPAGDRVLRRIAMLLSRSVRQTDVVARYGGEEFAVIMSQSRLVSALRLAERCRRAVEEARWPQHNVTVSVGAATLDLGKWDGHALVEVADQALYKAKRRGRNRIASTPDVVINVGR